jgi:hypothetical protein
MSSTDLEALQACKDTAQRLSTLIDANQKLTDYYNTVTLVKYNTDHDDWDKKRKAWVTKHDDWINLRGDYSKFKDKDFQNVFWNRECWGKTSGCYGNINPSDWHCGRDANDDKKFPYAWDWKATGNIKDCGGSNGWCSAWGGYDHQTFECKRSQDSINNANNDYKNNEPLFNDKEPNVPQKPLLNSSNVSVTCCANKNNIIGSDVSQTTITQVNNCLGNLDSQITAAKAAADKAAADKAVAAAKAAAEAKAAVDKAAADKAASDKAAADKAASDKAASDKATAEALAAANAKAANASVATLAAANAKAASDAKAKADAASAADQTYILMFVVLIIFLILFSIVMLIL